MNVIPRFVYISPMTFLLIFFAWAIDRFEELLILFLVVSLHELAHIITARLYKIKLDKILFTPIGLIARLNYTSYKNDFKEMLICAAGPISNIIMALLGYILNSYFWDNSKIVSFFILSNISILILNILPVLPLDGGKIFRVVLLSSFGYKRTIKIFFFLSHIISIILIVLGVYQLMNCWYNLSLLFVGIFIYLCMYKEKDEFQFILMRDLIHKREKIVCDGFCQIENIICFGDSKVMDVIKNFYSNRYHIVKVIDENMKVIGEINETDMMNCLTNYDYSITLSQAIENCNNNQK